MKDAYSFDVGRGGREGELRGDARGVLPHLRSHGARPIRMVAADSGAIGGSTSAEFQVLADSGEDAIVACDTCDYAANVEVADGEDARERRRGDGAPAAKSEVHTPRHGTIEEITAFLGVGQGQDAQVAVYVGGRGRRHGRSCAAITT